MHSKCHMSQSIVKKIREKIQNIVISHYNINIKHFFSGFFYKCKTKSTHPANPLSAVQFLTCITFSVINKSSSHTLKNLINNSFLKLVARTTTLTIPLAKYLYSIPKFNSIKRNKKDSPKMTFWGSYIPHTLLKIFVWWIRKMSTTSNTKTYLRVEVKNQPTKTKICSLLQVKIMTFPLATHHSHPCLTRTKSSTSTPTATFSMMIIIKKAQKNIITMSKTLY